MRINQTSEHSVSYKNMLGVDFSIGSYDREMRRYAYLENMYRDYESGDSSLIESVPGFRKAATLCGRIHGIYPHKNTEGENYAVIHAKNRIYRFPLSEIDNLQGISPIAEISDQKSSAFRFGTDLYVIDGKGMLKISADGICIKVNPENDTVYVPTTFYNEKRIEQKNLLTDRFREKYVIGAAETVIYGTPGIMYRISDEERGLCSVVGIDKGFMGILNVPSYAKIGTKRYKVDEIADNAFSDNDGIIGLRLGVGIYRIGKRAFSGCKFLNTVHAYNAPVFIDDLAFSDCTSLSTFFLGAKTERLGENVFKNSELLTLIRYASDEKKFSEIENSESLSHITVMSFEADLSLTVEIPVNTPTSEIISVHVDSNELTEYEIVETAEQRCSVIFTVTDGRAIEGKEVTVYARCAQTVNDAESGTGDFVFDLGYKESAFKAIAGCTVCESFDGRVFLSGNPSLPGVVFFSSRENGKSTPLYFGAYNYFCDGLGTFGVTSMLSCADSLLVFKNADDGGGSIFYHTPKETGISVMPKVYPVSYTHNGIGALGPSISFFDDPIFVSKTGICAIDKRTLSLERSIACRSHNVNSELLYENPRDISLAQWCGYLALGINGKIFLADSRASFMHDSGCREYEWYYMRDVGTYENDHAVYRYSSSAHNGYSVHPFPEEIPDATVFSDASPEGGLVYFTRENGKLYEVYPTGERSGGIFHPLIYLAGFEGDLLLFGTDSGDLCIFNNDKRGVAPAEISSSSDFDKDEYARHYGRRIHPSFYSFGSHRMRCGAKTAPSDCRVPGLTKNTVKHSLTLKCRLSGSGKIRCEIKTNRTGYTEYAAFPNNTPDFSDWSFASLTLDSEDSVSLPINEKEKNWIDKEISVYCDDFCTPIGLYSVSYRYTVKGRIKHT